MFQYAAGRSLSIRHDVPLKMDLSGFSESPLRAYCLHCFKVVEEFASSRECYATGGIPRTFPQAVTSLLRTILFKTGRAIRLPDMSSAPFPGLFVDKMDGFSPEFRLLPDNVYLQGYWQSEEYFKEIEQTIRSEFEVKLPPTGKNLEFADWVKSCQSVSVHVRRGDYVSDPSTRKVHGLCPLEYYQMSIGELAEELNDPQFFVFSDDPGWARDNLRPGYPVHIVDHNSPETPWEDLRLMSLCHHHIIANSTLGWWGAWLSRNPDKIVIAPDRWFALAGLSVPDLLPKEWRRRWS